MEIYKNKHVWLILILLLAFHLNFTPHKDYQYPVHVDEWVNFAISQAILDEGNVVYTEPFMGEKIITNDLEIGLRTFLAVFKDLTGFSWIFIFRYMPGIIFMITVLGVYTFANRGGYGIDPNQPQIDRAGISGGCWGWVDVYTIVIVSGI
jgi:hypothetical protein